MSSTNFDIFISYKRKSLPTANNLYYRLTTRGYSTFFDLEEMGRDNFNVQLLNYIENAKDVFVIIEEGSFDACKSNDWENDWFCHEIAFALEKKKNIIPILLNGYKMPSVDSFPNKLKELSLKNAPEFNISFFEAYLDKLVEKEYLISKPNLQDKTTSVFKFYSNENCQVYKEGKLVCSLEGMSIEPYYLPVSRKGSYRFMMLNAISSEKKVVEEHIDAEEEKNVMIRWTNHKNNTGASRRMKSKRIAFTIIGVILSIIIIASGFFCLVCSNPRYSTWYEYFKERIRMRQYQTIDLSEVSHGEIYGNHEAVDLGLSVKWATCNVGADLPFYSGDFFSWGETEAKQLYSWENYKYALGDSVTKYCTDGQYGKVDGLSVLCSSDDAASTQWGNGWRMPTLDETDELRTQCTFSLKKLYGVLGFVVTGPNKNSIFFPLSGDISGGWGIHDNDVQGEKIYVIYWTSSLFADNRQAYEFAISHLYSYWYSSTRNTGHNIRPVHD